MRVYFVLLAAAASVAPTTAVRVPSTMQRLSTLRGTSPVMAYDDDATRDPQPVVFNPSKQGGKGATFAKYMAARRSQMTGAVVATRIPQARETSNEAAPVPAPAPAPAPPPAAMATPTVLVQGGSLRTWTFRNPNMEAAQVVLSSEGRPIEATIELWQGPGNVPCTMKAYVENGQLCPFSAVIATPRAGHSVRPSFGDNVNLKPGGVPNTVAIRNIGQLEFPFAANVIVGDVDRPSSECVSSPSNTIQGGALRSYPFDPSVDSVQVLLQTSHNRPLYARIEILQGPNNNKQIIELYSESGLSRPFFAILETPGAGSVIRIENTASLEYPLLATVVPDSISHLSDGLDMDGDMGDLNAIGFGDACRVGRYG